MAGSNNNKSSPKNILLVMIVTVHLLAIGLGVLGVMIHGSDQHTIQSPYNSWLQILSWAAIGFGGLTALLVLYGLKMGWL